MYRGPYLGLNTFFRLATFYAMGTRNFSILCGGLITTSTRYRVRNGSHGNVILLKIYTILACSCACNCKGFVLTIGVFCNVWGFGLVLGSFLGVLLLGCCGGLVSFVFTRGSIARDCPVTCNLLGLPWSFSII